MSEPRHVNLASTSNAEDAACLAVADIAARSILTDATQLDVHVPLPDVRAALVMKAPAYAGRLSHHDALVIWRLLQSANNARHTPADWPTRGTARDATVILHRHFAAPRSGGPRQAGARWLLARHCLDLPTASLGLIAGRSAAIVGVAEDLDADSSMVTFMQYLRLVLIVLTTPRLATLIPSPGSAHTNRPAVSSTSDRKHGLL